MKKHSVWHRADIFTQNNNYKEIINWCSNNFKDNKWKYKIIGDPWSSVRTLYIHFKNKEDLILFQLTWR